MQMNHAVHRYFIEGVAVEYPRGDGSTKGDLVWVFDRERPENNEFLAVNQFTVVEGGHERRPDVVVFINGLPVGVVERSGGRVRATLRAAIIGGSVEREGDWPGRAMVYGHPTVAGL
jgi:hypothetical protein